MIKDKQKLMEAFKLLNEAIEPVYVFRPDFLETQSAIFFGKDRELLFEDVTKVARNVLSSSEVCLVMEDGLFREAQGYLKEL